MLHCFAATPVLVAQELLVLFSHTLDKIATEHNLDTELSFYIPALSTLMCPPTFFTSRDIIKLILG